MLILARLRGLWKWGGKVRWSEFTLGSHLLPLCLFPAVLCQFRLLAPRGKAWILCDHRALSALPYKQGLILPADSKCQLSTRNNKTLLLCDEHVLIPISLSSISGGLSTYKPPFPYSHCHQVHEWRRWPRTEPYGVQLPFWSYRVMLVKGHSTRADVICYLRMDITVSSWPVPALDGEYWASVFLAFLIYNCLWCLNDLGGLFQP